MNRINFGDLPEINLDSAPDFLLGFDGDRGLSRVPIRVPQYLRELNDTRVGLSIGDSTINGASTVTPTDIAINGRRVTLTIPNTFIVGNYVLVNNLSPIEITGIHRLVAATATTISYDLLEDPSSTTGVIGASAQVRYLFANGGTNILALASAMAGAVFDRTVNLSIGGETTDLTLRRYLRMVELIQPAYVHIASGINSINTNIDAITVFAWLKEMLEINRRRGILTAIHTVGPLGSSHVSYSLARVAEIARLNRFIRQYVNKHYSWCDLIDVDLLWRDSVSTAGDWKSGYTADHIHALSKATFYAAKDLAPKLAARFPRIVWPAVSVLDDSTDVTDHPQLLPNGLLTGSGGTVVVGAGNSGTMPDGWSAQIQGAPVSTVNTHGIARADGIGYDMRCVITANGSGQGITQFLTTATFHQVVDDYVGRMLRTGMHVKIATDVDLLSLQATFNMTADSIAGVNHGITSQVIPAGETLDAWFVTPPLRIPNLTLASCRPRFTCTLSGTGVATTHVGRVFTELLPETYFG